MPKIMTLGNCTCDGWINSAQDLSDRIVNSSIDFPLGGIPMFSFCPYCGRKLLEAGAGLEKLGTWKGKPIQEYDHAGLIEIIQSLGQYISGFKEAMTTHVEEIEKMLGGS